MATDEEVKEVCEHLLQSAQEFEIRAIENERHLQSMLLWLMNKHKYTTIKIPLEQLNEIRDSQEMTIDLVNGEVTIRATTKAQSYDEFMAVLDTKITPPDAKPNSEFFELGVDLIRAAALPAIDRNVV